MKMGRKAQSMLEYAIVLTAIIGIIIFAASQWIKPAVKTGLDNTEAAMGKAADKF